MPRTSIAGLCSALYSHFTTTDPMKSQQPRLPASLPPIAELDPGTVYIAFLHIQGVPITSRAWEYAMHLNYGRVTERQENRHKARVEYLSRLEEQHTTLAYDPAIEPSPTSVEDERLHINETYFDNVRCHNNELLIGFRAGKFQPEYDDYDVEPDPNTPRQQVETEKEEDAWILVPRGNKPDLGA